MIDIKKVSVRYRGTTEDALSDINLSFKKGDFICILGKSGAGKSTFIRTINGLQTPTIGEIHLDGLQISNKNEKQLRIVRREMGMVFQHFNLIPRLTVIQNVLTGKFGYRNNFKSLIGWFTPGELEHAERVISDMGLSKLRDRRVEHLSGGQKQRVGIARALIQQPKILLGDEPVASLDPGTSNEIFALLKELHNRLELLTIINVHDIDLAKRYATRILSLKDGEIIFDGSPDEFTEDDYQKTYHSTKPSHV
ncbi:phosphonate ABC transporter ATP-binding protein [Halobacillus seohaensis]|uniref:Phosphonate ABC transporter ATP-binding protein n=1 Tax=Halobacillus seohaensis TaxID=447421 RepID=A0ABW2ET48_9BACI